METYYIHKVKVIHLYPYSQSLIGYYVILGRYTSFHDFKRNKTVNIEFKQITLFSPYKLYYTSNIMPTLAQCNCL